ncbi:MAG: hypothetical protein K2K60_05295, partial [Clostridia bacterium]|nr:hypothetical protein [Clostridia bacterium]
LVIFFFIFLIIFPDNAAMAKKAKKKYDKLLSSGASEKKVEIGKARAELWEERARSTEAERDLIKRKSLATACALKYFAYAKKEDEAKGGDKKAELSAKKQTAFYEAVEAIKNLG